MKILRLIFLTTILLILCFTIFTYLDRAQLYEHISLILISTNFAAYLIPPLVQAKSVNIEKSFTRTLVKILVPSLISIPIFVCLVCIFNILTVSNFLDNIPLYQFVLVTSSMQLAYALPAAFFATIALKLILNSGSTLGDSASREEEAK